MKGPMATQSLRGMANHGPMHWRGDRTGGNDAPSVQPDSGTFDERAAFKKFQLGFVNLLGRSEFIPDADMEAFTDFILQLTYPPNPIRALDNSLTPDQQAGHDLFMSDRDVFTGQGVPSVPYHRSAGESWHRRAGFLRDERAHPPSISSRSSSRSPTSATSTRRSAGSGCRTRSAIFPGNNDFLGDQIRGFGFLHDGSVDTTFRFHSAIPVLGRVPGQPDRHSGASTRR